MGRAIHMVPSGTIGRTHAAVGRRLVGAAKAHRFAMAHRAGTHCRTSIEAAALPHCCAVAHAAAMPAWAGQRHRRRNRNRPCGQQVEHLLHDMLHAAALTKAQPKALFVKNPSIWKRLEQVEVARPAGCRFRFAFLALAQAGHMPHFPAGASLALAVEVQVSPGLCQYLVPAVDCGSDKIFHFGAISHQ